MGSAGLSGAAGSGQGPRKAATRIIAPAGFGVVAAQVFVAALDVCGLGVKGGTVTRQPGPSGAGLARDRFGRFFRLALTRISRGGRLRGNE